MTEYVVVPHERAGLELDEFLCMLFPELTKGFVRRQVRDGLVLVDGSPARPSQPLRPSQVLVIDFDEEERQPRPPVAPARELDVLHEDEDLIVIDKPAGLAVEPERWARDAACVSGGLLALARSRSGVAEGSDGPLEVRLRAVHRLDKDTSGALVVAKHLESERFLRRAFEEGAVSKRYLALVEGEHPLADGETVTIDLPLGPDAKKSGRMVVSDEGKPSRTIVGVAERFRGYTLLACEPVTGRTHQIRVHLAAEGFPLAVDPRYGRRERFFLSEVKAGYKPKRGRRERPLIDRLTLHAARIDLPVREPNTPGERLVVEAPLPKDFSLLLKQLAKFRARNR